MLGTRAALLLGVALGGCTTRAPPVSTEEGNVTPPPAMPPPPPAPPTETLPTGPFFVPEPDGRPTMILRADAPNVRYAALDREACFAELEKRSIPFERTTPTAGVLAPVRLRGPLHGVAIHSIFPPAKRAKLSFEIFDCRLVLALDDFSVLLAEHEIVEAVNLSAYRSRSERGCTPKYIGKQHCAAVAVDIGSFKKRSGAKLDVEKDFHGKIGTSTCASPKDNELWTIVCEAARRGLFHVILTPNYNWQHRNHFHLEITPDAGWMLIK